MDNKILNIVILVLGLVLLLSPGAGLLRILGILLIWYGVRSLIPSGRKETKEDMNYTRKEEYTRQRSDDEGITIVSDAKEVDYTKE